MAVADRANRTKFRDQVLKPMLADGLLEVTIPDKPTSSKQRYRATDKGRILLASPKEGGAWPQRIGSWTRSGSRELEHTYPGVSRDKVRRILREQQAAEAVECQGRGPGAR